MNPHLLVLMQLCKFTWVRIYLGHTVLSLFSLLRLIMFNLSKNVVQKQASTSFHAGQRELSPWDTYCGLVSMPVQTSSPLVLFSYLLRYRKDFLFSPYPWPVQTSLAS